MAPASSSQTGDKMTTHRRGGTGGARGSLGMQVAVPVTVLVLLSQLLPMAQRAEAACAYNSDPLHKWTFQVWERPNCAGRSLQYWGTNECQCYNIGSALNDRVQSFVFTSAKHIDIYINANCRGQNIGHSQGNWIRPQTSATGKQMSSFRIC